MCKFDSLSLVSTVSSVCLQMIKFSHHSFLPRSAAVVEHTMSMNGLQWEYEVNVRLVDLTVPR